MGDSTITSAIAAAARRGVRVEVTMTDDSEYDGDWDSIVQAGGQVHLYADSSSDLYIHAKTTVADSGFATRKFQHRTPTSACFHWTTIARSSGSSPPTRSVDQERGQVSANDFTHCTSTDCQAVAVGTQLTSRLGSDRQRSGAISSPWHSLGR